MSRTAKFAGSGLPQPVATRQAERVKRPRLRVSRNGLYGLGGLAGLVILVQILPYTGIVSSRYLPPSSDIGRALATELNDRAFWRALGETMSGWAIGLAIAVGAGVVLGVAIGSVPALRA